MKQKKTKMHGKLENFIKLNVYLKVSRKVKSVGAASFFINTTFKRIGISVSIAYVCLLPSNTLTASFNQRPEQLFVWPIGSCFGSGCLCM